MAEVILSNFVDDKLDNLIDILFQKEYLVLDQMLKYTLMRFILLFTPSLSKNATFAKTQNTVFIIAATNKTIILHGT